MTEKTDANLSLFKILPDHRVRRRQSTMLRNFVRSRSPVTVIVTIESHDVDPRLDMGATLSNEWKGTDVAEETARSTVAVA
jgi:hypothetical protein